MSDPTCQLLYKERRTLLYRENKTSPCTHTQCSLAKELAPESSGGSDKLIEEPNLVQLFLYLAKKIFKNDRKHTKLKLCKHNRKISKFIILWQVICKQFYSFIYSFIPLYSFMYFSMVFVTLEI